MNAPRLRNLVLIGMPGVGKSTAGVLLAKRLSMGFLDTDLEMQSREGCRLQDILDSQGIEAFCRIEEEIIVGLCVEGCVVATGGSAIYSPRAMRHLASGGTIVHLELALALLEQRAVRLEDRGVVMPRGQTLAGLYSERLPLYRRYAQVSVDCAGRDLEAVVDEIVRVCGYGGVR